MWGMHYTHTHIAILVEKGQLCLLNAVVVLLLMSFQQSQSFWCPKRPCHSPLSCSEPHTAKSRDKESRPNCLSEKKSIVYAGFFESITLYRWRDKLKGNYFLGFMYPLQSCSDWSLFSYDEMFLPWSAWPPSGWSCSIPQVTSEHWMAMSFIVTRSKPN